MSVGAWVGGGLALLALSAAGVALGEGHAPRDAASSTYVTREAVSGASDGPWFPTMRAAALHRAARDGLAGPLYVDFIPDGFGPPDVARRPAVSDGRTFCVMYASEWHSSKGWRIVLDADGMACEPFAKDGEPHHPDGTIMQLG